MAGSIRSLVRSIVPNSNPNISLLRIYADWTERLPIVAWDVHLLELTPAGQRDSIERTEVIAISLEEKSTDCIECIMFGERVYDPDYGAWDSREEAVTACQLRLRKAKDKADA